MSQTDAAVRVISASPDRVFAALTEESSVKLAIVFAPATALGRAIASATRIAV